MHLQELLEGQAPSKVYFHSEYALACLLRFGAAFRAYGTEESACVLLQQEESNAL